MFYKKICGPLECTALLNIGPNCLAIPTPLTLLFGFWVKVEVRIEHVNKFIVRYDNYMWQSCVEMKVISLFRYTPHPFIHTVLSLPKRDWIYRDLKNTMY